MRLITNLRQMAMTINRASGYEKNMDVVELVYKAEADEEIGDLVALIQAEGLVAIISGLEEFEDIKDADGVLLDDAGLYQDARSILGEDAIIGISCGADKDKAQKAIDMEADFVVLNGDPSLISWFSAQSTMMSVASSAGISNHNCGEFVRSGAGFMDVTDYILEHEKGVMQGTVNIMHAIDLAGQVKGSVN